MARVCKCSDVSACSCVSDTCTDERVAQDQDKNKLPETCAFCPVPFTADEKEQKYDAHWDYFFHKEGIANGGNRYATVLTYLNTGGCLETSKHIANGSPTRQPVPKVPDVSQRINAINSHQRIDFLSPQPVHCVTCS